MGAIIAPMIAILSKDLNAKSVRKNTPMPLTLWNIDRKNERSIAWWVKTWRRAYRCEDARAKIKFTKQLLPANYFISRKKHG